MFYLDRDVPLVHGHSLYIDSHWALTSISQRQFWPGSTSTAGRRARSRGSSRSTSPTGRRRAIRHGKTPCQCSERGDRGRGLGPAQGRLNDGRIEVLERRDRAAGFLDPDIVHPNPTAATNLEPLLVNTAGSWDNRPRRPPRRSRTCPRLRLRAHPHRPGDHGGRERGGAAGRQRDPGAGGIHAAPVPGLAALRARDLCSRAGAGPGPVCAPPSAGADGPRRRRRVGSNGRTWSRRSLRREADLAPALDGHVRAVQTLREGYAALNRGEWERSDEFLHPEISWHFIEGQGPDAPETLTGRAADRRVLEHLLRRLGGMGDGP